jgi:hypothetical protein
LSASLSTKTLKGTWNSASLRGKTLRDYAKEQYEKTWERANQRKETLKNKKDFRSKVLKKDFRGKALKNKDREKKQSKEK